MPSNILVSALVRVDNAYFVSETRSNGGSTRFIIIEGSLRSDEYDNDTFNTPDARSHWIPCKARFFGGREQPPLENTLLHINARAESCYTAEDGLNLTLEILFKHAAVNGSPTDGDTYFDQAPRLGASMWYIAGTSVGPLRSLGQGNGHEVLVKTSAYVGNRVSESTIRFALPTMVSLIVLTPHLQSLVSFHIVQLLTRV
jgi:hypothetical protein